MEQPESFEQFESTLSEDVKDLTKIQDSNLMENTISPQGCPSSSSQEGIACSNAQKKGNVKPNYIYAIGKIEVRFPSIGIEKEFAQAVGREDFTDFTDRQILYSILSKPENLYLSRKLCWVFSIKNIETYILKLQDSNDLNMLINSIRLTDTPEIDIIIGLRGPLAQPEVCNGLIAPIVLVDQVYNFGVSTLIKAIPRPVHLSEDLFEPSAEELFDRIMHMTDNAGSTDRDRALNYLSVRYKAIYNLIASEYAKNFSLSAIDVQPSVLSSTRKIVEVIFTYTNRQTDFVEKFFVRVDVTEEFPFLITQIGPYYDL